MSSLDLIRPKTMYAISSLLGGEKILLPNPDMDSGERVIGTLVNSTRNSLGVVTAQKIGRDQGVPARLAWNVLSKDDWETMVRFWDKNFFFNFEFYDEVVGKKISISCYVGDRSRKPVQVDDLGIPIGYRDCYAEIVDTGQSEIV